MARVENRLGMEGGSEVGWVGCGGVAFGRSRRGRVVCVVVVVLLVTNY